MESGSQNSIVTLDQQPISLAALWFIDRWDVV